MEILYHAKFLKHYQKWIYPVRSLRLQVEERISLFIKNSQDRLLKDHPLKGTKSGLRAFSITGDYRIVYRKQGNVVVFVDIGTHNQVY